MICKERNAREHPAPRDATTIAGVKAETQLAFYLRRAFGEHKDIHVFNDLRLVDDRREVAQIDHLVLHPLGFVVIESKSVTGRLRINANREWTRVSGSIECGIRDPVEQARQQRDVLRRILGQNVAVLRPLAPTFTKLGFDVLVAIADQGIIERELPLKKVMKADQIAPAVQTIIRQRKEQFDMSPSPAAFFTPAEMRDAAGFLLWAHTPYRKPAPPPPQGPAIPYAHVVSGPAVAVAPRARPHKLQTLPHHCPRCGGTALEMFWSDRPKGYYFHCIGCENNWKPDYTCPNCGRRNVFPRQTRGTYLQECRCGMSRVFHRNA